MIEQPTKKKVRFSDVELPPASKEVSKKFLEITMSCLKEITSLMPKGVPYAESMSSQSEALQERIRELEKQVDDSKEAYENSQLKLEELEQKNYALQK